MPERRVPALKYLPERRPTAFPHHYTPAYNLWSSSAVGLGLSVSVDYDSTVVCVRAFCMYVCAMQWKMETGLFRSTTIPDDATLYVS